MLAEATARVVPTEEYINKGKLNGAGTITNPAMVVTTTNELNLNFESERYFSAVKQIMPKE